MAGKREQQMKEITERLEQGVKELFTSEMYTEYLKTMSQFHNYSFNNTLLIAMQKPDATLVAGYQAWQKKFRRQVKKGEKGIQIIAPAPIREKEEVEKFDPETNEPILRPDGQPETEEVVHTIPRFRVATVFDVSQTYGEPLPELETPELMGSVENFENFMQAIREVSPVPIRFDEIESGAKGYYSNVNKETVIQDGMSERQTMKTAVHETTHAKLHDRDIMEELGEKKNQMTREVEAESVAYTVCQYFGLDTSDYSFPYIAGWSSSVDMKELRASMDTIRKTAGEFIDSMTEVMQRLMLEQMEKEHLEENKNLPEHQEEYQQIEFFGVPALFANGRIDRETLPEGMFCYELRGADYDPGYPLTVEEHVTVNHAATVLTAVPVPLPEQGYLRLGDGLNFIGGMQTIWAYQQGMAGRDLMAEKESMESAIGRANENLYLSEPGERYAIYQIARPTKGREYQFMGMDFVTSHDMTVDAEDYDYIYGGRLSGEETLESLYEKFNINHPVGYEGHSLSVSDVVVLQKDGHAKAYYVDRLGFTELPDFVRQRLHEAEMNRKREDSAVTLDTSGIEIEQHEGLWHTVDKREIADEIFYLMKNNEYGDSVAAVIVNADGELVAQELENGFDRGAMEAIREYFAEKGIEWEPEVEKEVEIPEKKSHLPVYRNTLAYAIEHGAADEYLDSRKRNIDCKKAVEDAIRSHFDGMYLAHDAADAVLEEYGGERLFYVLACTVQYKESDGRFSGDTKAWAASIPVPENISRGIDLNRDYVVESHPAVLDGFIGLARDKFAELEKAQEQEKTEPFIARYYVVNDAYGVKVEREYQYFENMETALSAYSELPNHLDKQLGMESTEQPPSRMPLINCRNGIEDMGDIEFGSLSGKWVNDEVTDAYNKAQFYLDNKDSDIVYELPLKKGYFYIQTTAEGFYDYTFYDREFREVDGGSYENTDISIQEAVEELLAEEGISLKNCHVVSWNEFMDKAAESGQRDLQEKVAEYEKSKEKNPLTAASVTKLKGRSHEYNEGAREAVYEFDCLVEGRPAVLTYTTGQREHFYSPLYDRGEIEDVFSIHTDGEDIWERMPEPELSKLEHLLAGEAETFLVEEQIAKAVSILDLKEIDYDLMDRETTAMTKGQKGRLWDGIARKGNEILEKAIAEVENKKELQAVGETLAEAQGLLDEAQYKNLLGSIGEKETELASPQKVPLVSDWTEPERAFGGLSRAEIEETVLCYAQAQIEVMGLGEEVKLLGARVYGSRTRAGLYHDGSDVDVVLSYTGNIREDVFFDALHEDGMDMAGLPLDINPISTEKTGTLEEYMESAEQYLDEKEIAKLAVDIDTFAYDNDFYEYQDQVEDREQQLQKLKQSLMDGKAEPIKSWLQVFVDEGEPEETVSEAQQLIDRIHWTEDKNFFHQIEQEEPSISFYVAECMEFPILGEYYDNLTLQEAVEKYEEIPADRINGIKGIGFRLEDGSIYDGDYELMSGGEILRDSIDLVPHYKESPLVQKAMADLEEILSKKQQKEVIGEEPQKAPMQKEPEQPSMPDSEGTINIIGEMSPKPGNTPEKTPEADNTVTEGTGRKQSVLKALRERQAKLKEQEQKNTGQKAQNHKKGDQEL